MADLASAPLVQAIGEFSLQMRAVRESMKMRDRLYYPRQQEWWHWQSVNLYVAAVQQLDVSLKQLTLNAPALQQFRQALSEYRLSEGFSQLQHQVRGVHDALSNVRYCLEIEGNHIVVRRDQGEEDYTAVIQALFAKFHARDAEYRATFSDFPEMNHIEAEILERVARLYPDVFATLSAFSQLYPDPYDPVILRFDREIQFYVAYREFMERIEAHHGVRCSLPQLTTDDKAIYARDGFDIALAYRLLSTPHPVVPNDFWLQDSERIIVVTGPNQGGKTTFARTFGQLHYLASLGCPVPARAARLFLADAIWTHFEREEGPNDWRGKLEDELQRMHDIAQKTTARTIVVVNEIFSSTTARDALILSQRVINELLQRDCLAVWVTFLDEVALLDEKIVSMVATVDANQPSRRTFKLVRKPPDGRSYAWSIAEKYRLTYSQLKERLRS
jgi:hypothetical protein